MSPVTITLSLLVFFYCHVCLGKNTFSGNGHDCLYYSGGDRGFDVKTAFAGFINQNVILFVAMFVVGGALFETGVTDKIGSMVTRYARQKSS